MGKGQAAGRVGSDFLSAIAGRVGSGRVNVSAGRVGSKKSDPWTTLGCSEALCLLYKVWGTDTRGVIWGLGWGAVAPKEKEKMKEKRERKEKKEKKEKKRKKGTMNSVKLLHIKCCFFQFFSSPVALKNEKKICPPRKS